MGYRGANEHWLAVVRTIAAVVADVLMILWIILNLTGRI